MVNAREIRRLLGEHTKPTSRGWYNFCHKRCGDKRFRLGVNFNSSKYRCFNCGATGYLEELIPGIKDAIDPSLLAPITLPTMAAPVPSDGLPWFPLRADGDAGPLATQVLVYLASRGIPKSQAVRLGLGVGVEGRWLGRVIHPYYDPKGRLAGWQGRLTYDPGEDEQRKILFASEKDVPPGFPLMTPDDGALYLIDRVPTDSALLVCEGPYDAIHAERAIPAVALFGSNLTAEQERRILAKRPTAIYVGLDRDKSGVTWDVTRNAWLPDPRLSIARRFYQRTLDVPIYLIEYPEWFEGDFGGKADKTPHSTEEIKRVLSGARRFQPGAAE